MNIALRSMRCRVSCSMNQANLGMLLLGALLWISLLDFPHEPAATHLDSSWQQALGYAYKQNLQAGIDYIFTFGPLGYFHFSPYDKDLFWTKIVWEGVIKLYMVVVFVIRSRRLDGPLTKFFYFALLITTVSGVPSNLYPIALTAVTVVLLEHLHWPLPVIWLGLLFLAVIALVKFNYLLVAGICVLALLAALWRYRGPRVALGMLGLFVATVVGIWGLCGQSPLHLPSYLASSLQVARGYSEAMAIVGPPAEVTWALVVLALAGGLIGLTCYATQQKFMPVISGGMVAAQLFLAWKHGFVRHDGHALLFFPVAALTPFLLFRPWALSRCYRAASSILVYAMIAACLVGLFVVGKKFNYEPNNFIGQWNRRVVDNAFTLGSLQQRKANYDHLVETRRQEYDLPQIRKEVGHATVDIVSYEQGVLFLNRLNWRTRPVFQSYSAYTASLLAANAAFFSSQAAPTFIIFKLQTIDDRFPTLDDADAMQVILRHYEAVLIEKSYLLLRRKPWTDDNAANAMEQLLARNISFGEDVDIAHMTGECHLLSLHIRYSLAGQFRQLLYKSPPVYLELKNTDGASYRYRIIPAMTPSGFILNPLLHTQGDFIRWHAGTRLQRVASFRLVVKRGEAKYFASTIAVHLARDERLVPVANRALGYPGIHILPD